MAPNAAVVAIIKIRRSPEAAYKSYLEGKMPEKILPMGAAQGVIYIGEYYKDDIRRISDKLNDIQQKLAAGESKSNSTKEHSLCRMTTSKTMMKALATQLRVPSLFITVRTTEAMFFV